MAWSDAARQAAAAVRRLHEEAKANWHMGGTPRFNPYDVTRGSRKQAADALRRARSLARQGVGPYQARGSLSVYHGTAAQDVQDAARRSMMLHHPVHPRRMTAVYSSGLAAQARKDFDARGRARAGTKTLDKWMKR